MDEIWERAVETALDGQTDVSSVRTLTLDGVVKCVQGRLPPPSLFEKFQNLQHLSIANIGVSSLEQFPRLQNLEKLILSDNRIAGGLEFLVAAGLNSLRDLDLSNNRIQDINDLRPLAELRLVSLDLYECPVTRVKDYRSRVFGLIKSLKYLDKMDAEENERPESDDEEDEDDEDDDPGSGEIDGEERPYGMNNGHRAENDGIVDVDEDESDADEEETEISRGANDVSRGVLHHQSNGFRVEEVDGEEEDDEDGEGEGEDEEDNDSADEIDEEGDDDEDVVEVHEIEDSDDEEDGVEDDEDEDDEDEEDDDEEEVDNDDGDFGGQESAGRLTSTEGEIDGHEQGEDDEDDNGETGEEEQGVEEEGDYEVDEDGEDEVYGLCIVHFHIFDLFIILIIYCFCLCKLCLNAFICPD